MLPRPLVVTKLVQLGFYRLSSVVFAVLKAILQKDRHPYWVAFASDTHSKTRNSSVEATHNDNRS